MSRYSNLKTFLPGGDNATAIEILRGATSDYTISIEVGGVRPDLADWAITAKSEAFMCSASVRGTGVNRTLAITNIEKIDSVEVTDLSGQIVKGDDTFTFSVPANLLPDAVKTNIDAIDDVPLVVVYFSYENDGQIRKSRVGFLIRHSE